MPLHCLSIRGQNQKLQRNVHLLPTTFFHLSCSWEDLKNHHILSRLTPTEMPYLFLQKWNVKIPVVGLRKPQGCLDAAYEQCFNPSRVNPWNQLSVCHSQPLPPSVSYTSVDPFARIFTPTDRLPFCTQTTHSICLPSSPLTSPGKALGKTVVRQFYTK